MYLSLASVQTYKVNVINRSLTNAPLLSYPQTSFSQNILNPAWIPLPNHTGGGIFFRTIAAPGTTVYNGIGFVKALDSNGLVYPKATMKDLLHDGTNKTLETDGADPRAIYRELTGDYLLIYQGGGYSGRHSVLSRTKTPLDITSWKRDATPLFANMTMKDGRTPLQTMNTALTACNDATYLWEFVSARRGGTLIKDKMTGLCLSQVQADWNSDLYTGLKICNSSETTRWYYDAKTKQLKTMTANECLDVYHGTGPSVSWYDCHNQTNPDFHNQQFIVDYALPSTTTTNGTQHELRQYFQLRSVSALNGTQCVAIKIQTPNDSGSSLWFPYDEEEENTVDEDGNNNIINNMQYNMQYNNNSKKEKEKEKKKKTYAANRTKIYSVATFGELRGGNLSLVSSYDFIHWKYESILLKSRSGMWDDGKYI